MNVRIISPSELGLLSVADLKARGEYEDYVDDMIDEIDEDGLARSMCECCDKQHSYPGPNYYDLCHSCAVEQGYETSDHDWRIEANAPSDS